MAELPTLARRRTSCFIKRPDPLLQRGCGQADQARTTIYHRVSQERTDLVAFSVANRITYVKYRYTPWIQATPTGEGVYLFYEVWNGSRFQRFDWGGSSE